MQFPTNYSSVKRLSLSNTKFVELPEEVLKYPNLQQLRLYNNRCVSIPEEICQLTQLQQLEISYNPNVRLPQSIGKLKHLKVIILRGVDCLHFPEPILACQQLEKLVLDTCSIAALPNGIGNLKKLKWLNLNRNNLTSLPPDLWELSQLEFLALSENEIHFLPPEIGRLRKLEILHADSCELKAIPPTIGALSHLRFLILSRNPLHSLPPSIGNCTSLSYLQLYHVTCETLPDTIGKLQNLTEMGLAGSKKLKKLPDTIGNCKKLMRLYIREMELEEFPLSLLNNPELYIIELFFAQKDNLPVEFTRLKEAKKIVEQDNRLINLFPQKLVLNNQAHLRGKQTTINDTFPLDASYLQLLKKLSADKSIFKHFCERYFLLWANQSKQTNLFAVSFLVKALRFPLPQIRYHATLALAFQAPTIQEQPIEKGVRVLIVGTTTMKRTDIRQKLKEQSVVYETKLSEQTKYVVLGRNVKKIEGLTREGLIFLTETQLQHYFNIQEKAPLIVAKDEQEYQLPQIQDMLLHEDASFASVAIQMLEAVGVPPIFLPHLLAIYRLAKEESDRQQAGRLLKLYGTQAIHQIMPRKAKFYSKGKRQDAIKREILFQSEETALNPIPIFVYLWLHYDVYLLEEKFANKQTYVDKVKQEILKAGGMKGR